eukprot:5698412-Heterocapsa_arctica.AAC.1
MKKGSQLYSSPKSHLGAKRPNWLTDVRIDAQCANKSSMSRSGSVRTGASRSMLRTQLCNIIVPCR